ncbi:hypothetical protein EV702DRAFT_1142624 [Suillus placidus]|uniref:MARVEL domain-containing protein n=1 Tax=Suillus placidus TaxID=48579 RepID=A0A9P6ZJR3_9AGAM|nr:hypothetical protein EV702DRAFT_1142624 [Suillus placidus]
MGSFSWFRITVFSLSIPCSLIGLGLNAYSVSLTEPYFYFIFSALGVATAVLTILTIPIMLIVDFIRRGAFTSMIIFELSWLFTLAILSFATSAESVSTSNSYFPRGCVYANTDPTANKYCMELLMLGTFAFSNFIMFLSYTCILLVFSIIGSSRGNSVWTYSVKDATFFGQNNSWHVRQQVPLNQYSGAPPTGYTGTPVSQPQQLGTHNTHSGTPAQSPHMQPQQFQPVYSGQPQGISV